MTFDGPPAGRHRSVKKIIKFKNILCSVQGFIKQAGACHDRPDEAGASSERGQAFFVLVAD
jgi:hypothetical protein